MFSRSRNLILAIFLAYDLAIIVFWHALTKKNNIQLWYTPVSGVTLIFSNHGFLNQNHNIISNMKNQLIVLLKKSFIKNIKY